MLPAIVSGPFLRSNYSSIMTSQFLRIVIFTGAWLSSATAINGSNLKEEEMFRGFPAAISCGCVKNLWPASQPIDNQILQCVIVKDERVLFNESIQWGERSIKGRFFDVTDEWHNTTITITLTTENETVSRQFVMLVKEAELNIVPMNLTATVEAPFYIDCPVPREMIDFLSKEQFNSINTIWRKDGKDIRRDDPQYQYVPAEYDNHRFERLKILNASFAKTPGSYECILEYNRENLTAEKQNRCVRDDRYTPPNIKPGQDEYVVAPGNDVTLYCSGKGTGSSMDIIRWKKNGQTLCWASSKVNFPGCKLDFSIATFCRPASEEDIWETRQAKRGNFTSVYTLRNVTYGDAGVYECVLVNTGKWIKAEFSIVVKGPETRHNQLQIALGVAAACIGLCLVFGIIYYWKRMEIRYLKKKFDSYKETDKPVTYLVYANDVVNHEMNENPLRDIREWMKSQGYTYHDPNDGLSYSDAGEHVIEHSMKSVEKCLSMTIILTPELLEENTLEMFKIYTGFEDNIKRNFPLVFVCSKKMEKKIYGEPGLKCTDNDQKKNKDVFVTFRRLMKRNSVIHWKPGVSAKFYRALYVALPKARPQSHCKDDQINSVFEGKSA